MSRNHCIHGIYLADYCWQCKLSKLGEELEAKDAEIEQLKLTKQTLSDEIVSQGRDLWAQIVSLKEDNYRLKKSAEIDGALVGNSHAFEQLQARERVLVEALDDIHELSRCPENEVAIMLRVKEALSQIPPELLALYQAERSVIEAAKEWYQHEGRRSRPMMFINTYEGMLENCFYTDIEPVTPAEEKQLIEENAGELAEANRYVRCGKFGWLDKPPYVIMWWAGTPTNYKVFKARKLTSVECGDLVAKIRGKKEGEK